MEHAHDNTPEPVLDGAQLHANTGGDVALAAEILGLFQEQLGLWSRLLDPALPQDQWADAAHSIKGSAASVGARQLAALCSQAEAAGRAPQTLSRTEAAVVLSAVKDAIGPALEATARRAHQLSLNGSFD